MLYSTYYLIIILLFTVNGMNFDQDSSYQSQLNLEPTFQNNMSSPPRLSVINQLTNYTLGVINELYPGSSLVKETIGDVVFNVHHFTQFLFDGNQVYIYSPKKNEENINEPQKWTFFYVPILQPMQTSFILPWVTINKLEVRVRLALGTSKVEAEARQAIANQFDRDIAQQYSPSWVIAPLMLDSLSAYVVTVGSTPVPGVLPFHIDNPNSNVVILRFVCLTKEATLIVAAGLLTGDFDIEISLYFAGMHRVRTNMMTITASQLQSVLSKTIADGGRTNATYIHRDQAANFVAKYMTNVKKFIYIEDSNVNTSIITHGLQEQLGVLFQDGINTAKEIQIKADAYGQVWHSDDLHPDHITTEMSNIFTFNKTETERHNNNESYYSINQRKDCYLPVHTRLDRRIATVFTTCYINGNDKYRPKNNTEYENTTLNAVSESDIRKAASEVSIEGIWKDKKFIPKSFKVYKLIDITNRLQIGVIGKQLLAEKANGAVIRRVGLSTSLLNTLNLFASLDNETLFASLENTSLLAILNNTSLFSSSNDDNLITSTNTLTGEIKLYAGANPPLRPWLLCDGSIISRSEYSRLFSVIGTKYGNGTDSDTFRLPDLRGRIPLGVDIEQLRVNQAIGVGVDGGQSTHRLSIQQLPSHVHDSGTFENSYDGQHTHNIYDPGHNHGGFTGTYPAASSSSTTNSGEYNYQANGYRQWQALTIATSFTQISLLSNGNHTHKLTGQSGTTGGNEAFSILPPFQTFYYIIYAN